MRKIAIVNVQDVGPQVQTKYRYRVVEVIKLSDWLAGTDVDYGGLLMQYLRKYQPQVFSDDGIPVAIKKNYDSRMERSKWWRFPDGAAQEFLCFLYEFPTGCTLPASFKEEESSDSYMLELIGAEYGEYPQAPLECYCAHDEVVSFLSPLSWLFYIYGNNAPDRFMGGKEFKHDKWTLFSDGRAVDYEAKAYGIAVRLQELEKAGKITESSVRAAKEVYAQRARNIALRKLKQTQNAQVQVAQTPQHGATAPTASVKPPYRIIALEKEKSSDFAYSFELELAEGASISAFFAIRNEFVAQVRAAYLSNIRSQSLGSLFVDTEEKFLNGRVVGRAVVLAIAPLSLAYDSHTRRGKLSVRFNPGQYEEARAWARKNIETLARDKNIALATGRLPPDATYYSLGESVKDGNILEIEFKTE